MPGVHTLVVTLLCHCGLYSVLIYVCFCSIMLTVCVFVTEKRAVTVIKGLSRPDSPQLLCCPVYAVSCPSPPATCCVTGKKD